MARPRSGTSDMVWGRELSQVWPRPCQYARGQPARPGPARLRPVRPRPFLQVARPLGCRVAPSPPPPPERSPPRPRPSCCSLGRAAPWRWPLSQRGAPGCCRGPPFCGGDTYVLGPCSVPSLWFAVACNVTVKPRGIKSQPRPAGEDRDGPTGSGRGGLRTWSGPVLCPGPVRAWRCAASSQTSHSVWVRGPALPAARAKLPARGVRSQWSCHVAATRGSAVPAHLDSGRGHGPHLFMGEVAENSQSWFKIATRLFPGTWL